jgi:hypothetical protein
VWTAEKRQRLLDYVMSYKSKHPGTSDTEALKAYRAERAKEIGRRQSSPEIPSLKVLQNQLALAHRQELPEKTP